MLIYAHESVAAPEASLIGSYNCVCVCVCVRASVRDHWMEGFLLKTGIADSWCLKNQGCYGPECRGDSECVQCSWASHVLAHPPQPGSPLRGSPHISVSLIVFPTQCYPHPAAATSFVLAARNVVGGLIAFLRGVSWAVAPPLGTQDILGSEVTSPNDSLFAPAFPVPCRSTGFQYKLVNSGKAASHQILVGWTVPSFCATGQAEKRHSQADRVT